MKNPEDGKASASSWENFSQKLEKILPSRCRKIFCLKLKQLIPEASYQKLEKLSPEAVKNFHQNLEKLSSSTWKASF